MLYQTARKVVVAVIGSTVILVGVALFVLPGPGWLVVFAGLAILATEFVWARRLLRRVRQSASDVAGWFRGGTKLSSATGEAAPQEQTSPRSSPSADTRID